VREGDNVCRLRGDRAGVSRAAVVALVLAALLAASTACATVPGTPSVGTTRPPPPAQARPSPSAASAMPGLPRPDHIVIVIFENKDVDQVLGSDQAPFLNELARTGVEFTNAHAEVHPSQPNYLALFAGSTLGVTDDSCLPPLSAPNLATQLAAVGQTFVGYSEDLPEPGFTGCRSGSYAQKHAVWAAFTNLPPGSHRPWTAWPSTYDQLPTVAAVIPNLCNDMHDCDVATGDRWLRENLSDYLTWARGHNSLLLVTFDESDSSRGSNRIVTLLDGTRLRPGRVAEPIDHYRLLRTIEAMYGLPGLGRAAATTPISDIWSAG
jgi:phosphatidylinositol-3-phosphatase